MAAPIYLYTGPEFGERNEAVDSIKASMKKKFGTVDEYSFYLTETPLSQAMTTLQDGSLFSSATCVVIKGAEAIKNKGDIKIISDWVNSNPSDSSTLILVSDEVSVAPSLDKLVPASNKKKFWEMFEDRKLPWITNFFHKNGYYIEEEAAQEILDLIDNNTETMKNECSRFFVVFPKDHTITSDDVEAILSHNREESAFTLFNKLTDTNLTPNSRLEAGLAILQKMRLSKDNSSVMIMAGLASCFRKLVVWHKMMAANSYKDEFTMKTHGFSSKLMQKQYRNAAKIWSSGQAAAVLALLSSADMQIRSGGALLEEVILQKTIYEIVMKKGGSSSVWEQ